MKLLRIYRTLEIFVTIFLKFKALFYWFNYRCLDQNEIGVNHIWEKYDSISFISSSEYESNTDEDIKESNNISNYRIVQKQLHLRQKLVFWGTKNIKFLPHTIVNELLDILRSEGHDELPKTAETLLKTKRTNGIVREMLLKKDHSENISISV